MSGYALYGCCCWCIKLLSAYGANFSVQDEDGSTALHLAAAAGYTDTCVFLAQRGMTLSPGEV